MMTVFDDEGHNAVMGTQALAYKPEKHVSMGGMALGVHFFPKKIFIVWRKSV